MAQKARKLLPLGSTREGASHKGYGLGVFVEILCGVLSGTITALNADQDPRGHFFGAIKIDTFRPAKEFKDDMDRLIQDLKSTTPIAGQERVYVAGEIEFETADERGEHGIRDGRNLIRLFICVAMPPVGNRMTDKRLSACQYFFIVPLHCQE